uniref:Putative FYVE and coiled-coil domain-containing protein n=1 Tax=Daphnia magna TaxID=35525 RepID=A0A0P6CYD7_9CRUS
MASRGQDNNEVFKASIEKNLSALFDCVKSLKTVFDDTQFPIDDDNVMLHRLGDRLEFLLHVGLRQSSGVFSRSRSPWHYINSCLSKLKTNHDGIHFVRGLSELKTPTGKLRSFLRFCLVHQCLADTLQQCTLCDDVTSEYYSANSLFSQQTWKSSFISSLYELNDIQYDLAPTGFDLDVGWPTFARKQFGSFNWSRQQRSSSRLSLSLLSASESQSVNSFHSELTSPLCTGPLNSTMTSSIGSSSPSPPPDPHEISRLISTIRQITEDKEELKIQLDSLCRQLGEERENGKKDREQMEVERRQYQEKTIELERRLELAHKQGEDAERVILEKDRQLAVVTEELKAIKFDQTTRQLEKEKENQAYQQQEEQLKLALTQLADNGQLIGSLQLQLSTLTGRNQEERQSLDAQFRQMELSLMTRNEECEGLVNEIRSTVAEMDQLRTSYIELQEKFKCCQEAESQARSDNQLLREESLMLRDKIVQLIKEKDCLWQRSDRLLHLQRIQATDQWVADGSIRDCQSCQSRFTIFVRRHHCRLCGRIFCHSCSDYWLKIASSSRPTRTCHECFAIHRQFSQPGATAQLSELPLAEPPEAIDLNTQPVVVQQPQSDGGTLAEPCAGFSVISDDEIVQSLNDSSPYSSPKNGPINKNIRTAAVRTFTSLVHDVVDETVPSESFVSAGMIYRIPIQVERPGCTLHWKFKTDPRSIAFAVVGAEDGNQGDDSLTRVIVETALHKSEEDFVCGQAELPLPGLYYVYFDNSYSRFSANKVTFHLRLAAPSSPI